MDVWPYWPVLHEAVHMGSSPITAPVEAVCARDHCAKPKCVSVPPEAFLGRSVVHLSSFFSGREKLLSRFETEK